MFFPDEGDTAAIAYAKSICQGCPVIEECLTYAVEMNQTEGIWGGTTKQERRRLRRRWLAALAADIAVGGRRAPCRQQVRALPGRRPPRIVDGKPDSTRGPIAYRW